MSAVLAELLEDLYKERNKDLYANVIDIQGQINRKQPMKPTDTINASQIESFCPRFEAIRIKNNIVIEDDFSAKKIRVFQMGKQYEDFVRDRVLGNRKLTLGKWKCLCCGHIPEKVNDYPRYEKPEKCEKCESKIILEEWEKNKDRIKGSRYKLPTLFSYVEEYTKDNKSGVGGFIDGFLKWNQYYILEVKTASASNFNQFVKKGPSPDHRGQIQTYMRQTGYKYGIIWYYNKNTSDEHLYYENYNPKYAAFLNNKGHALQDFHRDGTMPERLCPDKKCPRAKKCKLVKECF